MAVDKKNLAVVRQNLANAAFSHKVHEMAVERKGRVVTIFKILNVTLVSLVLILFVAQTIRPSSPVISYIGAGLTAGVIILLIIQLSFSIENEIVTHKNTALKYMDLRDRYKLLLADILNSRNGLGAANQRRDELLHEYQTISDLALQTTQHDYSSAMERLKLKDDNKNVWSDKQIDSLLPKELQQ
jgi:hypothetical protein